VSGFPFVPLHRVATEAKETHVECNRLHNLRLLECPGFSSPDVLQRTQVILNCLLLSTKN